MRGTLDRPIKMGTPRRGPQRGAGQARGNQVTQAQTTMQALRTEAQALAAQATELGGVWATLARSAASTAHVKKQVRSVEKAVQDVRYYLARAQKAGG